VPFPLGKRGFDGTLGTGSHGIALSSDLVYPDSGIVVFITGTSVGLYVGCGMHGIEDTFEKE
jgi:hypothetical protein